jgi:hypothetical protein
MVNDWLIVLNLLFVILAAFVFGMALLHIFSPLF